MAASMPVGAGAPDILLVAFDPTLPFSNGLDRHSAEILAYLRVVGSARISTLAARFSFPPTQLEKLLIELRRNKAITIQKSTVKVSRRWRTILKSIIAVEAKASNWRRAMAQASRNQVFASKSFVAFPTSIAHNDVVLSAAREKGLGVISVGPDGTTNLVRSARRLSPRIWSYYYELAVNIGSTNRRTIRGFNNFPSGRRKGIPRV
jgi:hypothetical protein